jgi:hypothetical protein
MLWKHKLVSKLMDNTTISLYLPCFGGILGTPNPFKTDSKQDNNTIVAMLWNIVGTSNPFTTEENTQQYYHICNASEASLTPRIPSELIQNTITQFCSRRCGSFLGTSNPFKTDGKHIPSKTMLNTANTTITPFLQCFGNILGTSNPFKTNR